MKNIMVIHVGNCLRIKIIYVQKNSTFAVPKAGVVKLADTPDLGSGAARLGGSSPSTRTT